MKFRYVPELDGLRAVAIVTVLLAHFTRGLFIAYGALGVDIFFVLSGYLITSILLTEINGTGTLDYRAFLMRRARRLLPALAAMLLAYAILAPVLFPLATVQGRWGDIAAAAFYVTNFQQAFRPQFTPLFHTWSLALEEQFYIVWPWVVLSLAKYARHRAASWLFAAWVALSMVRIEVSMMHYGDIAYYSPLHSTGLILGSMIAFSRPTLRLGWLALSVLLAVIVMGHFSHAVLQSVGEVATVFLIADAPRILSLAPMKFLGRISYGVYLWHVPLQQALERSAVMALGAVQGTLLLMAVSILAGWLSYTFIEKWFRKPPSRTLGLQPA